MKTFAFLGPLAISALLAGCASLSPDADRAQLTALIQGKTAGVAAGLSAPGLDATPQVNAWLTQGPLSAETAVRIALLNNPNLQAALAALGVSDAERVQAATLPNPHLGLGRLREGQLLEIERVLSVNVLGFLTLPWRAEWAQQQHQIARLQAAQDVIRLAAHTRKAWLNAVAAQQSAAYRRDVVEAAEASAELARRMARVGNWSRLNEARELAQLADARSQALRATALAYAEREQLIRALGLWGAQTQFSLPERLPELPATLTEPPELEARALRERLDLRAAQAEAEAIAASLGLTRATGWLGGLDFSITRNTVFDGNAATARQGFGLDLPLPLFDQGQSRNARAQSLLLQATERVREVAVQARSEAREAYFGWRAAHDLARHARDEVLPLRQRINDELVLRYSGMLSSVWELLADTRQNILAVNSAISAQRDFWLADVDLHTALTGTSPGSLQRLASSGSSSASPDTRGH
ncbi:MAG: hypothetical protein RLZZ401_2094 [Pseudomonadota bacterium]|jgi:outer membrane protein TolC